MIEGRKQGAVCEILINRSAKKNALTDDDFLAFTQLIQEAAASDAWAVLIHAAGGSFSTARDIGSSDPAAIDAAKFIRETVNPLFKAIREVPVPTIAAVEGHCLGGGFGVAFALRYHFGGGDGGARQPLPRDRSRHRFGYATLPA